jgi:hypothetical protein
MDFFFDFIMYAYTARNYILREKLNLFLHFSQ